MGNTRTPLVIGSMSAGHDTSVVLKVKVISEFLPTISVPQWSGLMSGLILRLVLSP